MIKLFYLLPLAIVAVGVNTNVAFAQSNSTPVCIAKTIPANAPESSYISSVTVTPFLLNACSDTDNDPLTLLSVTEPGILENGQITIPYPSEHGESVSVTYTVSDSNGGETSSTITLERE